jgi:Ran GTPase-activating protein (RanGAP) involved in mRNA processing and transport
MPIPQHHINYDTLSPAQSPSMYSLSTSPAFGGLSADSTWTNNFGSTPGGLGASPMWSFLQYEEHENVSEQLNMDMARHEQEIIRSLDLNDQRKQQVPILLQSSPRQQPSYQHFNNVEPIRRSPHRSSSVGQDVVVRRPFSQAISRPRSDSNTSQKSYSEYEQEDLDDDQQEDQFDTELGSKFSGSRSPSISKLRNNRFHFSPPPTGLNQSNSPRQPTAQPSSHHVQDHYLMKLAANSANGRKAYRFRTAYLANCQKNNVIPSTELIRALKTSIRTQQPFQRLSICHAQIDDIHVRVLIESLALNEQNEEPYDINEILLNHNNITDRGAIELVRQVLDSDVINRIVSVELFGNRIGDESCRAISIMLARNQSLRRLKLGDNMIGAQGAQALAEGLRGNTSLTQLHLGGNSIQVQGLQSIASALADNSTLTSLGLRDNNVGAEGMAHLADTLRRPSCALSDIQLKGNQIRAEGAMHLAYALQNNRSLKVLELQSNAIGPIGARALCNALRDNNSVHALNFNENELGDEGAEAVSMLLLNNTSITTLGLANNRIRKRGASALGRALEHESSAVTGLDLGSNEIGNNGAVSLAKALMNNTAMTSLDLRSCEIHLKGCLSLAEMAQHNTTLRHLDLGANYCKNQGAIAWASVLRNNSTLTRLCLTDNQVYHDGGVALAAALQHNYSLRNFSYGGQGSKSNKIESTIRRIIDSIVAENKKHWETNTMINSTSSLSPVLSNEQVNNSPSSPNVISTTNSTSSTTTHFTSNNTTSSSSTHLHDDDESSDDESNHEDERPRSGRDDDYILDQVVQPTMVMLPYESNNQYRFVDVSKLRENYTSSQGIDITFDSISSSPIMKLESPLYDIDSPIQQLSTLSVSPLTTSSSITTNTSQLPSWFTASMNIPRPPIDPVQLDQRLEYLFKNNLLKAQNPKFAGCYFIGNVINTLKKVFNEYSRIDEFQLVQFAYNNPKYYVHLSREMVKTQIKYLGDSRRQVNQQQQQQQQQQQHNNMTRQYSSSLDSAYRPMNVIHNPSFYQYQQPNQQQHYLQQQHSQIGSMSNRHQLNHNYPSRPSNISRSYGHFEQSFDNGIIGGNANVGSPSMYYWGEDSSQDRNDAHLQFSRLNHFQ